MKGVPLRRNARALSREPQRIHRTLSEQQKKALAAVTGHRSPVTEPRGDNVKSGASAAALVHRTKKTFGPAPLFTAYLPSPRGDDEVGYLAFGNVIAHPQDRREYLSDA